ncbi:hypothetical protein LWI28_006201 [Acer negundo]|uniref:Uncharacterized protein n=1 Tax=Acer negundo TaxID=4023 RepID=A0AAD5P5F0_ACENE|nr:hypothetical protein LWI28_006201 [Acer negundo]
MSSTCISFSGPSSTVVGSIPIPLPDVPFVQKVCSLLPCEASLPSSIVVSSDGHIMESLSSLLSREVSPRPPAVVSSGGPIMESLPSGDPTQSSESYKITDVFREAAAAGLSVCRTWAFSD